MRRGAWLLWLAVVICAPNALAADQPPRPSNDYYDLFRTFADTLDQVERNYVKQVDRRELMEAAIQGMLSKLDPYSAYIGPEELDQFRSGVESEFGGVGIQISVEGGRLRVISPIAGTPAYRAGIIAGDRILEIDGKSADGITVEQATQRLKGKPGTKVEVTVVHSGASDRKSVSLVREVIHVETVLGDKRLPNDAWDFLIDHDRRIGYIRLTAFSRDTARELRKTLDLLREAKVRGLVLDLRFNPGGLLNQAIEVSDLFVADGLIVSTTGRSAAARSWKARKEGTFADVPLVVLVNRYSASASEIVAACLQDHKRAVIIGERTWGKGSVQNVIELDSGHSLLKLTTSSYQRPNGHNIHRFPDSKETDEWGVRPNDGFELRLNDTELAEVMRDRRDRDIIRPQATPPAAAAKPVDKPQAAAKPPEPAKSNEAAKAAPPAKPDADPPAPPEKKADEKKPDDKPKPPAKAEKPAAPPVDRQLQKALEYLNAQIGKVTPS